MAWSACGRNAGLWVWLVRQHLHRIGNMTHVASLRRGHNRPRGAMTSCIPVHQQENTVAAVLAGACLAGLPPHLGTIRAHGSARCSRIPALSSARSGARCMPFPNARLARLPGWCRAATRDGIEASKSEAWSGSWDAPPVLADTQGTSEGDAGTAARRSPCQS